MLFRALIVSLGAWATCGKGKQRDREPSPFGLFYWPKWRIPTLSYTSAREISTRFYTLRLKKPCPFRSEPPHIGLYVKYPPG